MKRMIDSFESRIQYGRCARCGAAERLWSQSAKKSEGVFGKLNVFAAFIFLNQARDIEFERTRTPRSAALHALTVKEV